MTRGSNYGIEAEFTGCNRDTALQYIRGSGIDARDDGYHHNVARYWRITSDGSVTGYDGDDGHELVSPKLALGKPSAVATATVLEGIKKAGGVVDRSCGLHVHHNVNPKKHSKERIINSIRSYCVAQDTIGTILPRSRTQGNGEGYCQPITMRQIDALELRTMNGLGRNRYWESWAGLDRYFTVNPSSYPVHGTIEFRQHSGTLDAQKIGHWVRLTKAFMDFDMHYTVLESALSQARDRGDKALGLRVMLRLLGMPEDTVKYYMNRQKLFTVQLGDAEDQTATEYAETYYDPPWDEEREQGYEHCETCQALGESYHYECGRCHRTGCYGVGTWMCEGIERNPAAAPWNR